MVIPINWIISIIVGALISIILNSNRVTNKLLSISIKLANAYYNKQKKYYFIMLERRFNIEGRVSEIFEVDLYEFRSHLVPIWTFVREMIEGVKSGEYTGKDMAKIFENIYNMMGEVDLIYLLILERKA